VDLQGDATDDRIGNPRLGQNAGEPDQGRLLGSLHFAPQEPPSAIELEGYVEVRPHSGILLQSTRRQHEAMSPLRTGNMPEARDPAGVVDGLGVLERPSLGVGQLVQPIEPSVAVEETALTGDARTRIAYV